MREIAAVFAVWCFACLIVEGGNWIARAAAKADIDNRDRELSEYSERHKQEFGM